MDKFLTDIIRYAAFSNIVILLSFMCTIYFGYIYNYPDVMITQLSPYYELGTHEIWMRCPFNWNGHQQSKSEARCDSQDGSVSIVIYKPITTIDKEINYLIDTFTYNHNTVTQLDTKQFVSETMIFPLARIKGSDAYGTRYIGLIGNLNNEYVLRVIGKLEFEHHWNHQLTRILRSINYMPI